MDNDRLMAIAEVILKLVFLPGMLVAVVSLVYAIATGKVDVNSW